jgi:hypothetical protein
MERANRRLIVVGLSKSSLSYLEIVRTINNLIRKIGEISLESLYSYKEKKEISARDGRVNLIFVKFLFCSWRPDLTINGQTH